MIILYKSTWKPLRIFNLRIIVAIYGFKMLQIERSHAHVWGTNIYYGTGKGKQPRRTS